MRKYRHTDWLFQQALLEGEKVTLNELSERIEEKAQVRFRCATLRRMIEDLRAPKGVYPLTEVSEGIYKLNTNYYGEQKNL